MSENNWFWRFQCDIILCMKFWFRKFSGAMPHVVCINIGNNYGMDSNIWEKLFEKTVRMITTILVTAGNRKNVELVLLLNAWDNTWMKFLCYWMPEIILEWNFLGNILSNAYYIVCDIQKNNILLLTSPWGGIIQLICKLFHFFGNV